MSDSIWSVTHNWSATKYVSNIRNDHLQSDTETGSHAVSFTSLAESENALNQHAKQSQSWNIVCDRLLALLVCPLQTCHVICKQRFVFLQNRMSVYTVPAYLPTVSLDSQQTLTWLGLPMKFIPLQLSRMRKKKRSRMIPCRMKFSFFAPLLFQ